MSPILFCICDPHNRVTNIQSKNFWLRSDKSQSQKKTSICRSQKSTDMEPELLLCWEWNWYTILEYNLAWSTYYLCTVKDVHTPWLGNATPRFVSWRISCTCGTKEHAQERTDQRWNSKEILEITEGPTDVEWVSCDRVTQWNSMEQWKWRNYCYTCQHGWFQ